MIVIIILDRSMVCAGVMLKQMHFKTVFQVQRRKKQPNL